jgi:hypothetical protein
MNWVCTQELSFQFDEEWFEGRKVLVRVRFFVRKKEWRWKDTDFFVKS